jgi:TonB-linked SusC/RagA family outer membrane protein
MKITPTISEKMINKTSKISFRLVLTLFILCVLSMQVSFAQTANKDVRYTVVIKNKPFASAIKKIEKITKYSFSYATKDVNEQSLVTMNVKNGTIGQVVSSLVRGRNLTYRFTQRHIILVKDAETYSEVAPQPTQNKTEKHVKTIKGRVVDDKGEPLVGAVIRENGTNNIAVTDVDGNYTFTTEDNNPTINVSYIGLAPKSATVNGGRKDFKLNELGTDQNLSEVVVVGYGTIKKESLSSAISNINSDDLSRSSAVNTSGALAGKVAGINSRQSDGRPGQYTSINIRNMGTPLYVVDGVQMDEGQFNNIDYNDVESISILKDASAAIYGVRAANGVIVVTTKSGKRNQKCKINLNSYYGWQSLFRFPELTDAATYVRSSIQATTIAGTTAKYTQEEYQKYVEGTDAGYQSFNWKKFIWRNAAPQWYTEVSASGGSDKISYYMAVSHIKQESMAHNFGYYERTNMQLNVDANITNNFRVKAQVNGRLENTNQAAWDAGLSGNTGYWTLTYSTVNNPPTKSPYANNNPLYPALVSSAGYTNFAILTKDKAGVQNDNWRVLQANISGEWEPFKGLTFKGLFSYFNSNNRYKNRFNGYKLYTYNESSDTYNVIKNQAGTFNSRWQYIEMLNSQISINFKHSWNNAHNLNVFAGMEAYKTNTPGVSYGGVPAMTALKVAYFDELKWFSEWNENAQARLGYMGRLNYDYKGRYLLEMSARYDGSWKFPPNHRWGFFPSISAGWRISEEKFWKDSFFDKFMDNLKLRVSYGTMGDDNVSGYSAFDYLSGYNYNSGKAVLDGEIVTTSSVRSLPVNNISWLKAKTLDFGIDANFLNNRLSGTIDYFQRKRTGLPASRYDVVVPSEVGFGWPAENLNSDLVRGIDASLTWMDNINDFYYSVGGNVTLARTYYWDQYKPVYGNSRDYYIYDGHHRYSNSIWGYVCTGQFKTWKEIASYPVDIDGKGNSTLRPGDLIYKDLNNDGIITYEDQKPIGHNSYPSAGDYGSLDSRTPLVNFNFNLSAKWKGFDLAADFAGSAKFTHVFNFEARYPFWGESCALNYMAGNQWSLSDPFDADSELIPGKYPTMLYGNNSHSNYRPSTFWIKDVWFIKLRNLQFGYTFPEQWTRKASISKFRIYCLMQNLFSIDNMHLYGLDPEMSNVTGTGYPTTRIINIGFNLTF